MAGVSSYTMVTGTKNNLVIRQMWVDEEGKQQWVEFYTPKTYLFGVYCVELTRPIGLIDHVFEYPLRDSIERGKDWPDEFTCPLYRGLTIGETGRYQK